MEAPQYQSPPLDPAFLSLTQQAKQQDIDAADAARQRDAASLTARFGTLTSGDTAALLARYSGQLTAAQSGTAFGMFGRSP